MARNDKKLPGVRIDDRIAVLYGCDDVGEDETGWGEGLLATWRRPQVCHHWRQPVEIEPGVVVQASAHMDRPRTQWEWPEIGVYLSERWIEDVPLASFHWAGPALGPAAQVVVLPCPDGGLPLHERETQRVLAYALDAARAGRLVEVGCHAGHGRTGLALASLMILAGDDPETAMDRVWKEYCDQAIETRAQERYLRRLARKERRANGRGNRRSDDAASC